MEGKPVEVRLVEKNLVRCHKLSETLEKTTILNLDRLESRDLLDQGIDRTDLVIAVTGDDDTNILASLVVCAQGLDLVTGVTAVAATLNNIGPGLGGVGPMAHFGHLPDFSKFV